MKRGASFARQRYFRILALIPAVLGVFAGMAPTVYGAPGNACGPQPSDFNDIRTIADWIGALQYANSSQSSYGAIKIHHTVAFINQQGAQYYRVVPYNANVAVAALLGAPVQGKLAVAEKWIRWYLAHLNAGTAPGIVLDHWYLSDGSGETTCPPGIDPYWCNHADSFPSYAATFLGAAWAYYGAGGNVGFLNAAGNKQLFETVAGAILNLQQTDGLVTENNSQVRYLMDNSEVYWGLMSMANLEARVFNDPAASQTYSLAASRVRDAISKTLFNSTTSLYRVAKLGDASFWEADLNVWYPGTVDIAWPHLFGVTDGGSRIAQTQMKALDRSWDGQPNPDWTRNIVDPNHFLWPSIGYAALLTGDCSRARTQANFIKAVKFPTFPWPFSVDEGGWLLSTLSRLSQ